MPPTDQPPPIVSATRQLEDTAALDSLVRVFQPFSDLLSADQARSDALRGMWLGHAVHPILTFVPLGAWTSASILDAVGGRGSQKAAQRLVAVGILGALPTALTGLAEFGQLTDRDKRTAAVHAVSNQVALGLFVASYRQRRSGRHVKGAALGLVAHAAAGFGGFLGGHLATARKAGSAHPAFEEGAEEIPQPQGFPPVE